MYILIIARNYPSKNSPQNGIFEFDQAKALQQSGHKVIYISIDLRSIRRRRKLGKTHFIKEGIEIYNISVPLGISPSWLFIFVGKIALKLIYRDVLEKHGHPDIVHAHFSTIAAVASWIKKKYRIPLIVTEHSSKLNTEKVSNKTKHFCIAGYSNAAKVISVSSFLSQRLMQHFNVESIVVHNIVDTDSFKFTPQPHRNFTFISVGNLNHGKGFDILINAFARLECNDIEIIIIGDGPENHSLKKQIDSLDLSKKITLPGRKTRDEINELMNKSDAFVLASRGETFGVVYIEAMAAGLPVIATRCGGPEEFINENNGILIPVDNVNQLAEAMISLYHNYKNYDGSKIMQQCNKLFSPEAISKQLTQVYKEVLNKIHNS